MFCAQCGAPNDATARFCFKCGSSLSAAAAGPAPAADPRMRGGAPPATISETRVVSGKNPVLGAILSFFIPGVGQFINGDMKKGAVMLVLAIVLFVPTFGVGTVAIQIWSVVDAYRVASGTAQRW
jgi:TM2 domain-containing membrane protein YozV